MCGRYSQSQTPEKLIQRFAIKGPPPKDLKPRYNIAPSQSAPVVVRFEETRLELFRWGLIPSWTKDPSIGNRMINARAETLTTKPSFRRPFKRSRCLVPADGFYEWQTDPGEKTKTPMRVRLRSKDPFAFAGLWDLWKDQDGSEIRSFTIITTDANEALKPIHERMPVILKPEDEELWLDPATEPEKLIKMLAPYPNDEVEAYEITKLVNSPRNDTPDCIQPA
jgi:putative SOS response-associated peptidase YedK